MKKSSRSVTDAQRAEIVRRVLAGESYKSIAGEVGLAYTTVRYVAISVGCKSQVKSNSQAPWNMQFRDWWRGEAAAAKHANR